MKKDDIVSGKLLQSFVRTNVENSYNRGIVTHGFKLLTSARGVVWNVSLKSSKDKHYSLVPYLVCAQAEVINHPN